MITTTSKDSIFFLVFLESSITSVLVFPRSEEESSCEEIAPKFTYGSKKSVPPTNKACPSDSDLAAVGPAGNR